MTDSTDHGPTSQAHTPVGNLFCVCLQLPGAHAVWLPDGINSVERLPDLPATGPSAEHHILTPGLHSVQRLHCVRHRQSHPA